MKEFLKSYLGHIKCVFLSHEPEEKDIDHVLTQQYYWKIQSRCERCYAPLCLWLEPNCKEDEYIMQEEERNYE